MDKYIRISNKIDVVPRLALEKLGLSTKRNDPETIGQFGSGIKYAPIAAIRKGLDFVFVGNDNNGPYSLRYATVIEDDIECIVYDYGSYQKSSSFTANAGALSWETEFQIYREVVANAIDSGDWNREIVDEVKYIPGSFSVYITASPDMLKIYNDHDQYFCANREVLYSCDSTKTDILDSDNQTKMYVKGVLAFSDKAPSIFHMNFKNNMVSLNEERAVKNVYSMDYEIGNVIQNITDPTVIRYILDKMQDEPCSYYEFARTSSWEYCRSNSVLRNEFWSKYGPNAIAGHPNSKLIKGVERAVKMRNHKLIFIHNENFFKWLVRSGVKSLSDIAGEEIQYNIDYNIDKYPSLVKAIAIVAQIEPLSIRNLQSPIGVVSESSPSFYGMVLNSNKDIAERKIVIESELAARGKLDAVVSTLIHEIDHYYNSVGDDDPAFREIADQRIGQLMIKLYSEKIGSISGNSILFSVDEIASLRNIDYTIDYSVALECYTLKVGSKNFLVKSSTKNVFDTVVTGQMETIILDNSTYFKVSFDPLIEITEIKEV